MADAEAAAEAPSPAALAAAAAAAGADGVDTDVSSRAGSPVSLASAASLLGAEVIVTRDISKVRPCLCFVLFWERFWGLGRGCGWRLCVCVCARTAIDNNNRYNDGANPPSPPYPNTHSSWASSWRASGATPRRARTSSGRRSAGWT